VSVKAVLDVLMPLLEPASSRRDDSRARFVELTADPDILYGWPRRERFDPEGTGELDTERFSIRLAWAIDAAIEVAGGKRDRRTSDALFDKAAAIATWVRAHRRHDAGDVAVWEHLQITEVDFESLVTTQVRGIYLDLDGYTLLS
jgi:hypothetical protein